MRREWGPLAVLVLVLSACSASVSIGTTGDSEEDIAAGAVEVIAQLSDDGDLGVTETNCDVPASTADGTEFDCISITEAGQAITWIAEIDDDGASVNSTNLITTQGLGLLLDAVAELVSQESGGSFQGSDFDCGPAPIVLDSTQEMDCDLTLPDGAIQPMIVKVTDTSRGDFMVRTADG